MQDIYDEDILILTEKLSSISLIEASSDMNAALVQSKNETNNKNKIVTWLMDTGVQSTFIKKKLREIPHSFRSTILKVQGRYKSMGATK